MRIIYYEDGLDQKASSLISHVNTNYLNELFEGFPLEYFKEDKRYFAFFIFDDLDAEDEEEEDGPDNLLALVCGHNLWDWTFIHTLWVQDSERSSGMGSDLLKEVEELAVKNNCIGLHLETSTEKNVSFYVKNGFQIHGTLDNYPRGHIRYSLSKYI